MNQTFCILSALAVATRRTPGPCVLALILFLAGCTERTSSTPPAQAPAAQAKLEGTFRIEVNTPGGSLPFLLTLEKDAARIDAGGAHIEAPFAREGDDYVVASPQYDARLRFRRSGEALVGTYEKRRKRGPVSLPLTGTRVKRDAPAFAAALVPTAKPLAARYRIVFSSNPDAPALGVLSTTQNAVTAAIMTDTGDYRYLYGTWDGKTLTLAAFDFAHAFLFRAREDKTGRLHGDFWSGENWHENFEAFADATFQLDDGFGLATVTSERAEMQGTFTALDNTPWVYSSVEPGPRVIELFGTWCPNCSDATRLLVELERTYKPRGVDFLAVGFELSGDREQDLRALKRYVAHHRIPYRVVLADQVDKGKNGARLPFLDKIRAYPTTIFIDATGKVRAVHSGFSGPATGPAYTALAKSFREHLDAISIR